MLKTFATVGTCFETHRLMENLGFVPVDSLEKAEIVIFLGGEDVGPELYGEKRHHTTYCNMYRDRLEYEVFSKLPHKVLKVGICRGGQFLNVMNGGKMWQDVDGHRGEHSAIYINEDKIGKSFIVTSTHHQMMRPTEFGKVWVIANESSCKSNDRGKETKENTKIYPPDVEVVFYEDTNSLCFQPHPEFQLKSCEELFEICLNRAIKNIPIEETAQNV